MKSTNNNMNAKLSAENISYEIDDELILYDLKFTLASGQALIVGGSNGSGKTTLLRILCGLIQADTGNVIWNGDAIEKVRLEYYQQLTFIGHTTGIKKELTTLENIRFFSAISGLPVRQNFQTAIDFVGLTGLENKAGGCLSFGQQRRIALSRLITDSSTIWILDEPFSGLDIMMIKTLQACFVEHVSNGGILIFASHQHLDLKQIDTVNIQLD